MRSEHLASSESRAIKQALVQKFKRVCFGPAMMSAASVAGNYRPNCYRRRCWLCSPERVANLAFYCHDAFVLSLAFSPDPVSPRLHSLQSFASSGHVAVIIAEVSLAVLVACHCVGAKHCSMAWPPVPKCSRIRAACGTAMTIDSNAWFHFHWPFYCDPYRNLNFLHSAYRWVGDAISTKMCAACSPNIYRWK